MHTARAPLGSLWPQLQTQELLADLQWVAEEDLGALEAPEGAPLGDSALPQQQQQQLQLIQTLKAANEGKQPAAVAAAAALFHCERQRQQLFQEVRLLLRPLLPRPTPKDIWMQAAGTHVSWLAAAAATARAAAAAAGGRWGRSARLCDAVQVLVCSFQCELQRLAFLSACASIAPKRQHLVWSTALKQQEQEQHQQQQQLKAALGGSICCEAAAAAAFPSQLPSAAQSLEAYWERVLQLPVVFGGVGLCECGPLDLRQIEKDVTRETYSINNHILKGADGLLRLLLALCSRIREAEAATGLVAAAETAAAATETEAAAAATQATAEAAADARFSLSLPKTVEALVSLGLLAENFYSSSSSSNSSNSSSNSSSSSTGAAAAAAWPRAVWAAACRVFCALRILAVSSRTHGGGAAFAAAAHAFACPALPLLLQPDNQVEAPEQQQQQQQQQQQRLMTLRRGSANVTEVVTTCCARLHGKGEGPLVARLHARTPFKLLLAEHESQASSVQPPPQQQQQQELVRRLRSVAVDAHFFATLRSVSLRVPSDELLHFDLEVAHEVRRREAAASVLALALMRETNAAGDEGQLLTWLPAAEAQQWVFVTQDALPRAVETAEM
ncbi:hypothetical protein Esti_003035 [Eimeria stiedai]